MNETKVCSMVKDLLPLYVDNLTSKETNTAIESHMEACQSCQDECRLLKADAGEEGLRKKMQGTHSAREIDYLKKLKKYQNINLVMGAVISFFLGMCLLPAILVLSFLDKGIQDYQLARLQVAWHIVLFKMFLWGIAVCVLYLLCMCIVRRVMRRKRGC